MGVLQDLESLIIPANKLNADGVASASIAILEDGKISAHVITNGDEDEETVYQAASISKPITALAVAKLIDQGRISYDTKVIDHLPQSTINCLIDDKTAHLIEQVNIGMLLSHKSGLSQHGFDGYPEEPPAAQDVLAGRYPSNSAKVHFLSFPGSQYSYSGGGYVVLQLVLENLMQMRFPEIMKEIILNPLGMGRSWYGSLPSDETNYTSSYYTGFTPTEFKYHHFVELAAAGLWTTPTDLLKAISAVQESLHTDSGFLSPQTAKSMLTQVVDDPGDFVSGICRGWEVNDCAFQHHGSNSPGFETYFFGFHGGTVNTDTPSSENAGRAKNGIAIMTNSSLGHEVAIQQIFSAIFYLKDWAGFKTLSEQFGKADWVPYAAPQDAQFDGIWRDWIGRWEDGWQVIDNDGPAVVYKTFKPMRLKPAAAPVSSLSKCKKEIIGVIDGLKVGVTFTWDGDEQVIELLQRDVKTLKRIT